MAVGFVVVVVASTRQAAVPVGALGGVSGMSMSGSGGAMRMSMRDVDGRTVRIPDGHPGVIVFVQPGRCGPCVAALRTAAGASRAGVPLTVISVDSTTSRDDVSRLAAATGRPRAHYVVDDRNGSLASMFGASRLGAILVYDARGKIVGRPSTAAGIRRALLRSVR